MTRPRCDGWGKMPFIAKSAAPVASAPAARHWTFDRAALGGLTAFVAPPGYLMSEGLFEALQRQGRPVIWVRLGPEDRDPGTFLHRWSPPSSATIPGFGRDPPRPAGRPGSSGWRPPGRGRAGPGVAGGRARPPPGRDRGPARRPAGAAGRGPGLRRHQRRGPARRGPAGPRGHGHRRRPAPGPGRRRGAAGREAPRLPAAAARRAATLCQGAAADLVAVCGAAATLGPAGSSGPSTRPAGSRSCSPTWPAAGWRRPGSTATGPSPSPWRSATATRRCRRRCWGGRQDPAGRGSSRSPTAGPRSGPAGAARSGPPWPGPAPGRRDGPPGGRLPARPGRRRTRRPALPGAGGPARRRRLPRFTATPLGPGPSAAPAATLAPPLAAGGPVGEPDGHLLTVHLLGQLKVRLDDVAVDDWPSGRGRSLFKYLVTHRDPWPRRSS